ncbi:AAA family ATPase [Anthocerotibacter panamensis]|uniref:AAA family ATPase n=1 Tax=Anthocerotibacter panamensis TaxID=2857077 RepID=UPI001C405C10|nr:ATP-binding protein [Anthocerotibacter panamensis]
MLTRLKLENFKNFENAELALGPLAILVGANAAGKSNIKDALQFLHGVALGYSISDVFGEKYVGGTLQWKGIRGGPHEVGFRGATVFALEVGSIQSYEGIEFQVDYKIEVEASVGLARILSECLLINGEIRQRLRGTYTTANFFDEYTFKRYINPLTGEVFKDSRSATWEIFKGMIFDLQSMRFLDFDPTVMRNPTIPGQIVLGDRGENLSSVLQAICEDLELKRSVISWIQALTPMDAQDLEFPTDFTGKVLLRLVEGNGQKTTAFNASDGTLRFLGMIATLFGPEPLKILFIEELENGIHPSRLYLLLQLIEKSIAKFGTQIIATTHSPQLLLFLSKKALEHTSLVYRLEHRPDAQITRIMDLPHAREVLEQQDIARLFGSSWFEDVVTFAQSEEEIEPFILENGDEV